MVNSVSIRTLLRWETTEKDRRAMWNNAYDYDKNQAIEYFQKGIEEFNDGLLQSAKDNLKKTIHFDPKFALAYCYLSLICSDLGEIDDAVSFAERGLEVEPDYGCLHFSLAIAYEHKGWRKQAIERYLHYNKMNPGDPECIFSIGCNYHQLSEFTKAEEFYRKTIELCPRHCKAYYNLAFLIGENKRGSLDIAIEYLKETVEINPQFWQGWVKLGVYSSKMGYIEESIDAYNTALALREDLHDLHYNLGISYRLLGKHERAVLAFKEGLNRNDEDADAWFNLGVTYMDLRSYKNATISLQNAISIDLDHEEAHYRLGCVYVMTQEWEKAAKERDFLKERKSSLHNPLDELLLTSIT